MGKIIRMTLEEALAIKPTPEDLARLEKLKNLPDEEIDFSDIPETTEEDYATGRVIYLGRGEEGLRRARELQRGGFRPGAGRKPSGRKSVLLRITPETLNHLRDIAKRKKKTMSDIAEEALAHVR